MDQLNQYHVRQPNLDWQQTRHAAEAADVENNSFSASFFGDTDDDYEEDDTDERYYADDADEDDDNEDNASSFDLTGIFKRRAISWALAIFSPPATGPLFGLAAWIIQWQHKKDDET